MSAILQLAAAAAYAGVVLYHVLVVAKSPLNILYTWHPVGVSLFIFFATASLGRAQSIRGKVAASRQAKEPFVQAHGLLSWLALFSLIGAQACIYLTKEQNKRPHLTTYHGISGAATAGFFVLNVVGGVVLNTVPSLYKYIKFHRAQGYLIYFMVLGTHGTAVWRGYSRGKGDDVSKYVQLGLLGALGLGAMARAKLSLLPGGGGGAAKLGDSKTA